MFRGRFFLLNHPLPKSNKDTIRVKTTHLTDLLLNNAAGRTQKKEPKK